MPRILRILNRLIIGGPSLNATYLSRYMAPEYETMLVIGGKDDHEQDATHLATNLGLETVVVPSMKRAINIAEDRKAYNDIKKLIKDYKPDIVHTHAAKSGAIGRLAASACKVPVIVHTFHGHVFHSYFGKAKTNAFIQIERYLARKSSGIIAISDIQKQELGDTYKICPKDKIKVIPLGLDLDKFQQNKEEKRAAFRSKYLIADDEIAIGIIGRIVPVKNHSLFVASIAKLIPQSTQKLRFVIIGDGDMRQQTENELVSAQIDYTYFPNNNRAAQAICTSWLTEMDVVFAGLDIVALTSHNEGTPVSLIEAQAAGKPVVSTNVGGVADVVLHNQTGIITPPNDSDSFAKGLLQLTENADKRIEFGIAGTHFVSSRYSYQRLVKDMSAYYEGLMRRQ
ncbi:MAG: glycosyltransferase [Chitinophagaceae bacterium]|jgi:glycosyltransferase involved in cell wall biosynthesis